MENEQLKAWLSKLATNFKEREQMYSFCDDIRICRDGDILFFGGIRKVINALGLSYKERFSTADDGKKTRRVSFVYEGMEFVELEDCDAGDA